MSFLADVDLDPFELVFVLFAAGAISWAVWAKFRAGVEIEIVKDVAAFDFGDLEVVRDHRGRFRVSFYVTIGTRGQSMSIRALLTSAQAAQMAEMLREAACPGRNLAAARLNYRRSRTAAQASSTGAERG